MAKKSVFGTIVILIIVIGVYKCIMRNSDLLNNTESKNSLCDRQKNILIEQGLSTNYDELTASQQQAIVSIEEMLLYAEEKYNTSFSYAGYTAASSLEKEHMRAYPTSGNKETESFTIVKMEDGYEDDFINVSANEVFSEYISGNIKKLYPVLNVKIFSEITTSSLSEIPDKDTVFDGKVECSLWIFIDEDSFTEDRVIEFNEQFITFMKDHELYGMVQIILLKKGNITYLTKYNYTNYLSDEYYSSREILYINK